MSSLVFRSAAIEKGNKLVVVLALIRGQISPEQAEELGLLIHEDKETEQQYLYYRHPTNVMAFRMMRRVYKVQGHDIKLELVNAAEKPLEPLLLPRLVPALSKGFVKCFDPLLKEVQVPPALDKQVIALAGKYHPRLASAAVLTVIEDFDPEERAEQIRKGTERGEIWAYVKKTSAAERLLTGYDFKIHLCKQVWEKINPATRRYILDHELMHCGRSKETGAWELWQHDFQGFGTEFQRYGGKIKEVDNLVDSIVAMHNAGKHTNERRRKHKHNNNDDG